MQLNFHNFGLFFNTIGLLPIISEKSDPDSKYLKILDRFLSSISLLNFGGNENKVS